LFFKRYEYYVSVHDLRQYQPTRTVYSADEKIYGAHSVGMGLTDFFWTNSKNLTLSKFYVIELAGSKGRTKSANSMSSHKCTGIHGS